MTGSQVASQQTSSLQAGCDVNIHAAQNRTQRNEYQQETRKGFTGSFDSGVASIGYGRSQTSQSQNTTAESLTQSQISSKQGDTTIIASNQLNTEAAQLAVGKDLNLQGKNVNLDAATINSSNHTEQSSKQSGISIGVTYNPYEAFRSSYKASMQSKGNQSSGSFVGNWLQRDQAIADASYAATQTVVFKAGSSKSQRQQDSHAQAAVATQAQAGGKLNIIATEGNINSQGAQLSSEGDTLLSAANNIYLNTATSQQSQTAHSKRSGASIDTSRIIAVGTFNERGNGDGSQQSQLGSQISAGGKATLQTQQGDIRLNSATIVAQQDTTLNAGRDIHIDTQRNHSQQSETQNSKGIGSATISDTERFFGYMADTSHSDSNSDQQQRNQIGSLGGDVNLQAGRHYRQQSTDITAKRDINIHAQDVQLLDSQDHAQQNQNEKHLKIGAFAKVSSPIIDLANSIEGATKSKADDRIKALQGVSAVAQAYNTYNSAVSGSLLKAEVGFGFKTSSNKQHAEQHLAKSNTLSAGRDIHIQSSQGDIQLQNTQAIAANTIDLKSAQNLILESGQSQQNADGKNSNAGLNVGVGVSVGAQTGVYIYGEAGYGKGKTHLASHTHNNTTLESQQLKLSSQGDTTLKGATAKANRIDANVAGRLKIESQQDHSEQSMQQTGAGVRVQVSLGTAWEAGGNYSHQSAAGSRDSISQQSGLFAGEGGYHIQADSVHLKGGAITSRADKTQNELTAQDFSYQDISNHSDGHASSTGITLNSDMLKGSKYAIARAAIIDQVSNARENQAANETSRSILSDGQFHIASINGQQAAANIKKETSNANNAVKVIDVNHMLENVNAKKEAVSVLTDTALSHTSDEAYKRMFIEAADIYVLEKDEHGNVIWDDTKNSSKPVPKYRKLTAAEKANLKPNKDGIIYVANNGIFTSTDSAAQYADQHNANAQYFIYFPKSNNVISEMMIAGYMKFMENDFWGLTNATQENKNIMEKYGLQGVHVDGHSRGGLTTGNALTSVLREQKGAYKGALPNLTVNFFGSAYNPSQADDLLYQLQGHEKMSQQEALAKELKYEAHKSDPVAILIGGARPTGGNNSVDAKTLKEKSTLREILNLTGDATVHNCYGGGNILCNKKEYWKESANKNGNGFRIPQLKPASYDRERK